MGISNERRTFGLGMLATAAAAAATGAAAGPAAAGRAAPGPADDVDVLAARLAAGSASASALVRASLQRIDALDRQGPGLRAVIERNPDALALAAARDAARKAAGRAIGPLDGLPVLIKDNVGTADRMRTSAGSLALADAPAAHDAFLVRRLRDAGAVILGKTNLSEWANLRSDRSISGWSARGGLTRNPHVLDRNPSGSSSGSAAAVAAGYVPVAVGTETDGSIVSPAAICGIVGIKPTVGLVSRDGIIPLSHSQDTAGPMACTVRGAAALLQVLAGRDENDPATHEAPAAPDYLAACRLDALRGARIGLVRDMFGAHPGVRGVIDAAIARMGELGAIIVDPVTLPPTSDYGDAELVVLLTDFRADLERHLARHAPHAPIASLADAIEWNTRHAELEMRYFGQELFERAMTMGPLGGKDYAEARARCLRLARTEGIERTLEDYQLDALLAPTSDPAWVTDMINADHYGQSFSTPAAVAGLPHITVPAGFVDELPVGVSLVGRAYQEALLIGLAYAYEQGTLVRRAPRFLRTLALP